MFELDYAKLGESPIPFPYGKIDVRNRETGEDYDLVVEANAVEGWLIRYRTDPDGSPLLNLATEEIERERIEAPIQIVVRD